jgi:hypothetical protein
MTHGKRIPRTPTTKYGPPSLDSSHSAVPSARWLKTEGWHPYWYVFTNHSPTPDLTSHELKKLKRSKIWNKIHNLLTYVSLVFIMYQFIYNPRVKSIKMLILFENPLISSSIHIYPPLFFSLLQIQWEPRPVLARIQSKRRWWIRTMILWIRLTGSVFVSKMSKHGVSPREEKWRLGWPISR